MSESYFETDAAFLEIEASPREINEVRRAIDANNKYAKHIDFTTTPKKEIYFNFEQLGQMLLGQNESGDYGFSVSVAGEYEKSAFVPARNKDAAIRIFRSVAATPGLLRVDQTILEPNKILQAFYNHNQNSLSLVTSQGMQKFENVPTRDGLYALNQLCTTLGFIPAQSVAVTTLSGTSMGAVEAINPRMVAAVSSSRQGNATEICGDSVLISTGMSENDVSAWLSRLTQKGKDPCGLDAAVRRIEAAPGMRADMVVDADDAGALLKNIQSSATVSRDAPEAAGTADKIKDIKSAFNKAAKEVLEQTPNKSKTKTRKGPSFRP